MQNTNKLIAFLEKQTYIDTMNDFLIGFNNTTLQQILCKLDPDYKPKRKLNFAQRTTVRKEIIKTGITPQQIWRILP